MSVFTRKVTAAFLTDDGQPATGLSPTVRIRDLSDKSLVVTDATMSEVGDGGYDYDFTTYDNTKEYQVRCDAGSSIYNRYSFGWSPEDNTEELILLQAAMVALTAAMAELTNTLIAEGGMSAQLETVYKMTVGSWLLDLPNYLIFYDTDGVTEIARFECFDIEGQPAVANIAKVIRIYE